MPPSPGDDKPPRVLRLEDVFSPAECERLRERIVREVDAAPPLTEAQRRLIRRLAAKQQRSPARGAEGPQG